MQAKLLCKTGQLAGKEFLIKKDATIGKHPANDCVLDADIISGQHARIYFDDAESVFFVEDLNSRNGTLLDGKPVKYKEKLGELHVITFAHKFDFIFQRLKVSSERGEKSPAKTSKKIETPIEKTIFDQDDFIVPAIEGLSDGSKTVFDQEIAFPPSGLEGSSSPVDLEKTVRDQDVVPPTGAFETAKDAMQTRIDQDFFAPPSIPGVEPTAQKAPRVLTFLLQVSSINKIFELKEGENVVGRTDESDICLDQSSISRRHAIIRVEKGKVVLQDAGSKNKTFVNDEKIESPVEVGLDAAIRFGAVEAKLVSK